MEQRSRIRALSSLNSDDTGRLRTAMISKAAKKRALLVCFSHLRWDFVWQRPQHLLSRAAKTFDVLVIEEPAYESGATPHMRVSDRTPGIRIAIPILPDGLTAAQTIDAQRMLVNRLLAAEGGRPRLFWYYTPMAQSFSGHLSADAIIYDNMDELSAFRGASSELLALENSLFRRTDVVFTGGMSLFEAKRGRHPNVHGFPSSIDFSHFAAARSAGSSEPADQAGIARPRLGFFGVVDERMDVQLVGQVAELRPDWQFVMIGPVVKIDEADLPRRANIHWLGSKDYKVLPAYLAGWDVGFMPFAVNEATRFISPTKTPEFLAAGRPVVSTPIADVIRPYGERGLVEIASTAEEVVAKSEFLMARRNGPEHASWLDKVDRQLAAGSWDRTWASMLAIIEPVLAKSNPTVGASTMPTAPSTSSHLSGVSA
jgi:glycosyltransferase involved in cell wall biosynthesis